MVLSRRLEHIAKWILVAACLLPAAKLLAGAFEWAGFSLGANPTERLIHGTGRWAINLIVFTLCARPVQRFTGWQFPLRVRRMLGLFAFTYASLHFASYLLAKEANWHIISGDLLKRPYIVLGMTALLLLLPLAVTSTGRWQRRLGIWWIRLHRLVYVIAILVAWHFWWQVKRDIREPALYALAIAALLGWRAWVSTRKSRERLVQFAQETFGRVPVDAGIGD
jgi:methionine sulfoxide reductase heme-binding subunit